MAKKKVLVLSDAHIGGKISNFDAYKEHIIELMTQYDHVVMNGDDWELFYLDKHHIRQLSNLLEVVSNKSDHHWRKEFDSKTKARSGVENVIHGAKWFTEEFLEKYPKVYLHVVGGNHESVRRFHNEFEDLQKHHPDNFEWSPQAIRVGDALFTHAHLQMNQQTVEEYPIARLRDAEKSEKWADFLAFFASPDQVFHEWARSPDKATMKMHDQLAKWDGKKKLFVSHNGIHVPFSMDWVRHVFFGHTHVKFDNLAKDGVLYHNTGAIVAVTSQKPEDLGILEADLSADGKITNVRQVRVEKDKDVRSRPKPSGGEERVR